ncbi:hypothetical protein LCGC14_1137400 [marine sediment metagenome]|uniref:Right handed beta helix domain-containing protein n=1 Tax=marine sediment metagenome TaxID=412755 RepID=A0A0F9Q500_9ZZZZ
MGETNYPNGLTSYGIPLFGDLGFGTGKVFRLVAAKNESSDAYYKLMKARGANDNDIYATLATGKAALTTDRNDALLMYPGAHTVTVAITWSVGNASLMGAHSPSPWSNSTKITFSGSGSALSPMLTISGSDNHFRNIHFKDACSHADHHISVQVTGSGNLFEQCWFEGPTNATQGTDTEYRGVLVDGGGNTFRDCIFGTTAHNTMNGAAQVGWTGSCYRSTFDNCIFFMSTAAVGGRFLNGGVSASDISGPQFFRNCLFSAWYSGGGDRITEVLYNNNKSGTGQYIFDANCIFINANTISVDGKAFIWSGHPLTAAQDGVYAGIVENTGGIQP